MYRSTKTYGHDVGLSCCFRQHRATHSHCSKLHGYALSVKLTFAAHSLNDLNWVMDFGGLKQVKQFLVDTFDHKLVLAEDDPIVEKDEIALAVFKHYADVGILPAVGCEAFARHIFDWVTDWLSDMSIDAMLESVEVAEHGANSAIYSTN